MSEVTYTAKQYEQAKMDVLEVYNLARARLGLGCLNWNEGELANVFQVFRYAMREWASSKEGGVVLRALMYGEVSKSGELLYQNPVKGNYESRRFKEVELDELQIYCDDEQTAEVLEKILNDSYEVE